MPACSMKNVYGDHDHDDDVQRAGGARDASEMVARLTEPRWLCSVCRSYEAHRAHERIGRKLMSKLPSTPGARSSIDHKLADS